MSDEAGLTEVVTSDLRALLFWATIGITKSRGGFQESEIGHIIESYAESVKFNLPAKPKFMKKVTKKARKEKL